MIASVTCTEEYGSKTTVNARQTPIRFTSTMALSRVDLSSPPPRSESPPVGAMCRSDISYQ